MSLTRLILAIGLLALITGCNGKPASSSSGGSTNPVTSPTPLTSPTPVPSPTPAGLFEVIVSTTWDGTSTPIQQADCVVPTGTAPYGADMVCTNPVGLVNNSVTIPEGQLYFSQLNFTVNVNPTGVTAGCARATFQPYYYVASTAASFTPPWSNDTPYTCNTLPLAVGCYGGVAQDIVPTFPTFFGIYFITAQTTSTTWTAKSANSHNYGSNRFAVNNATNAQITAGHTFTNGDSLKAGGPYVNYVFECKDIYEQTMWGFTMILTDQDITGIYPNTSPGNPAINQFPDWVPTSWQY